MTEAEWLICNQPQRMLEFLRDKASDHLRLVAGGEFVAFGVAKEDLDFWLNELMPLILVVFDASADVGYWLYIQAYFEKQLDFDLKRAGAEVTVRIPKTNVLDQAAMREFAGYRNRLLAQMKKVVHHA